MECYSTVRKAQLYVCIYSKNTTNVSSTNRCIYFGYKYGENISINA